MAKTRRRLLQALAAILAITLVSWPAALASAADVVAFTIQDSRITESSGLARDTNADLYWTVNDSSAQGTVFGVTKAGFVKGVLGFRATPKDVEAVAMSGGRLFVADIGDNKANRKQVSVYYFDQPAADNKTVPYRSYDFTYPDGPHDAETLLADRDSRLYIVTKGLHGGIYAAPVKPSRQGTNKLTRVADAPAFVTDGVYLPGGDKIVLRTYVSILVLDAKTYKTVATAAAPVQRQGESVAVTLDGKSLLVGSEGKRSEVLRVPVPTTMGQAPSAGSTPPPTNRTTASASSSSDGSDNSDVPDDTTDTSGTSRAGTVLALSLAAFVAVVAGVVVVAVRKP